MRRPAGAARGRATAVHVLRRQLHVRRPTLSTRVDASSDASRVGGDQVRHVRFENGLMVLAPPRRLYAGVMQHQELAWERIGA